MLWQKLRYKGWRCGISMMTGSANRPYSRQDQTILLGASSRTSHSRNFFASSRFFEYETIEMPWAAERRNSLALGKVVHAHCRETRRGSPDYSPYQLRCPSRAVWKNQLFCTLAALIAAGVMR
jgi:hypothetical protein